MSKYAIDYVKLVSLWGDRSDKPRVLFAICLENGKKFLTISDDETIFYFSSQDGKIYGVAREKCEENIIDKVPTYFIQKNLRDMYLVSCKTPSEPKHRDFVRDFLKESFVIEK